MTDTVSISRVLFRHKGKVIQYVPGEGENRRQPYIYRESTTDVTFDVRSLPAEFLADDETAVAAGDAQAHKRAIERAINRKFDFRQRNVVQTTHVCMACDWSGTRDKLELVEDAVHRVAIGELMPEGQCPSCGTCIEVSDEHVPEYTLLACAEVLRKQGWIVQQPAEPLRRVA